MSFACLGVFLVGTLPWNLDSAPLSCLNLTQLGRRCRRIVYLVTICRLALLEVKPMSLGTITVLDGHNVDLGYCFILAEHISRASSPSQVHNSLSMREQ